MTRVLRIVTAIILASALAGPAVAQQRGSGDSSQPRFDDRRLGEEERIRQRREWFYSTRRAGTSSDADLWSLRLAAVEESRQAAALQRQRREAGFETLQNVWVSKGPSPSTFGNWAFGTVSGRIQALAADWAGGSLYAGAASGGVWKSTNDGLSWTSIFDSAGTLAVGAIALDPGDPDVIWVGTGDNIVGCESYFGIGLLRSADGGATWELRNGSGGETLQDLSNFASIRIDPRDSSRIVTGGRYRGCSSGSSQSGGIYTTDDAGLTWTVRLANVQIHEIARDATLLDVLWAGTDNGVYKSVDNGVTWILQTGLPNTNVGRTEIAIAPSDSETVYALFSSGPSFWRTNNGGATWSLMASGSNACDGQCWYNAVIRVDPTDRNTVYRGSVRLFKSVDGGSGWTNLTLGWGSSQKVHQDMQSMLVHPTDPGTFYIGSDGGLWKSTNGGTSFSNLNGNLNVTQFYAIGVDASDPERICGGAQDNSSLARDNNDVWDRQAVTGDGFVCQIDPLDSDYAYITSYPSSGYPNIWRSMSGLFGSFQDISGSGSGIIGGDRISWVTPYLLDPVTPSTLYVGTHRVYRSDDHGSSWIQVGPADLTGGSGSLIALEVNRGFPSVVYSGSASGRVWRSANGGADWSDITAGLPGRAVNDVGADPTNPDRAFAVVGGFNSPHVWEWNAGGGWTERDAGVPNVPANTVLMLSATDLLVGNDVGVFRSYDGGASFVPFMDGLPEGLVVTDLKHVDDRNLVTAGTYGRGAWQMTVDPLQPILLAESVVQPLTEEDGDGDDEIEPGETWSVRPILRNAGGQIATGASATLSTSTPGVAILDPQTSGYGDLGPGAAGAALTPYRFVVGPEFECGGEIAFDLVDVSSTNPPGEHSDQTGFFATLVQGGTGPPGTTTLLEEDFDPSPPSGWTHEAVQAGLGGCFQPNSDEWNPASKDGAHGTSFHCGNGPGMSYSTAVYAWLHPTGKDSQAGPGLLIPAEAVAATLTLVHWYDTADGQDGGQVAIDSLGDGQDVYTTLEPVQGYPGTLDTGFCNGLEGQQAFEGSSGGWITSSFDLMQHKGGRVWLAFVFGSDRRAATGEGWYVDEVTVEIQHTGAAVCDIAPWPGEVSTLQLDLIAADTVQVAWDDSCNIGEFPGQTYSIQEGDLGILRSNGIYTHTPVDGRCDRTSPDTVEPAPGNRYYLVVPAGDGREGGAGVDSTGAPRPQLSNLCGERRAAACP